MLALNLKDWVPAQIEQLPDRIRKDVAEILLDLRDEPFPADSLPCLTSTQDITAFVYGYRIVYKVNDDAVTIWKIALRD